MTNARRRPHHLLQAALREPCRQDSTDHSLQMWVTSQSLNRRAPGGIHLQSMLTLSPDRTLAQHERGRTARIFIVIEAEAKLQRSLSCVSSLEGSMPLAIRPIPIEPCLSRGRGEWELN